MNKKKIITKNINTLNILQTFPIISISKIIPCQIASSIVISQVITDKVVKQISGWRETTEVILAQNLLSKETNDLNKDNELTFDNYLKIYIKKITKDQFDDPIQPELNNIDYNILISNFPIVTKTFIGKIDPEEQDYMNINIFYLLGVDKASQEELDNYLLSLNSIIGNNLLYYAPLFLTEKEVEYFNEISNMNNSNVKHKLLSLYLNKKIYDLDTILVSMVLTVKEDLLYVRIKLMDELYADNPEAIDKIMDAKIAIANRLYGNAVKHLSEIGHGALTSRP
jgi:hypothetical protein